MADRRTQLKDSTAAAHARLDARVEQSGFFTSQSGYQRYLNATRRARNIVETMLDQSGAHQLYSLWPERKLGALILEDMHDLGLDPESEPTVAVERLTVAAMLGTLYVLEGSALGARIIGRRVAEIGMTPEFGARHLGLQTSRPRAWATFLQLLADTTLPAAAEEECVRQALATFELFEREYGLPA